MTLKIISPTEIVFQGEVDAVTLPGEKGRFTILNHHASLISTLAPGKIIYRVGDKQDETLISGGIVDIDNNIVSVCIK